MMNNALSSVMIRKYNGSRERRDIYSHNGSGFDYIFILKYITSLGDVEPLIKDGKFDLKGP